MVRADPHEKDDPMAKKTKLQLEPESNAVRFQRRYYSQLKGATIVDVRLDFDDDFDEPTLVLIVDLPCERTPGKRVHREIAILCDAEGNGPGFIDNLPEIKP
jgi:hypothetical protein